MNTSKQRLSEIAAISDEKIDTSDISELNNQFWENAIIVKPQIKQAISICLDQDTLEWFKSQSKGYQSLMNTVLHSCVEHQKTQQYKM